MRIRGHKFQDCHLFLPAVVVGSVLDIMHEKFLAQRGCIRSTTRSPVGTPPLYPAITYPLERAEGVEGDVGGVAVVDELILGGEPLLVFALIFSKDRVSREAWQLKEPCVPSGSEVWDIPVNTGVVLQRSDDVDRPFELVGDYGKPGNTTIQILGWH